VLLLGAGELIARVFFSRDFSGRFEYGYNPTAGFQENSDETVDLIKAGGRPFRPQKFSRIPVADTFRVMVFGNSVPYGYYGNGEAPLSETYSSLIAQKINGEGRCAEGINLCITGYGAKRVGIVLKQALRYKPSLVILHVFYWSDDELDERRWKEFEGWNPRNWPMKLLLIRHLYEAKTERVFGSWLPKAIREPGARNDEIVQLRAALEKPTSGDTARLLAQTIEFTRQNVALARQQGVPVILISQATKSKNADGKYYLDDAGLDDGLKPLTGPGVTLISMKQLLEARPAWENLFTDHVHLNLAGHELLSSTVINLIHEQKLLAAPK